MAPVFICTTFDQDTAMRNLYLLLLLGLFAVPSLHAQKHVSGGISSNDTVSLQVIRTFPDSFPYVSVVFRASGPDGQAIQNLDSSNVQVTEDGMPCRIVKISRVSKDWSVNTALVIDHSGSMSTDDPLRRHWDSLPASAFKLKTMTMREYTNGEVDSDSSFQVRQAPPNPAWYHSPLWYAQHAALAYVDATDAKKDQNSVIGFSNSVDKVLPLTAREGEVKNTINNLTPSGETAFYDAVSKAIDEADQGDGIRVVIAMTDGKDNASRQSLSAVIAKAKEKKIPVYVIGLGDVDKTPLQRLANQTEGLAYFTTDASSLSSIYKRITLHLQSIYEVVYESPSLSSADSTRDVQLLFDVDNSFLSSRTLSLDLPDEVIARLIEKENRLAAQSVAVAEPSGETSSGIPWGSAAIVVGVVAAGVLTARYVRNKRKDRSSLAILSIFPNPTPGAVTVKLNKNISGVTGTLTVTNESGQVVHSVPAISGTSIETDLSHLEQGSYFFSVQSGGETTAAQAVIVAR